MKTKIKLTTVLMSFDFDSSNKRLPFRKLTGEELTIKSALLLALQSKVGIDKEDFDPVSLEMRFDIADKIFDKEEAEFDAREKEIIRKLSAQSFDALLHGSLMKELNKK